MPRIPTGNANGRPPKPIDLKVVESLAALLATDEEIAAFFSCSVDTLARREGYAESKRRGQCSGKVSLRRAQFKLALSGNSRMQTWLGMQLLGQSNVTKAEITGANGGPLQTQDLTKLNDADLNNLESILSKTAVTNPGSSTS